MKLIKDVADKCCSIDLAQLGLGFLNGLDVVFG